MGKKVWIMNHYAITPNMGGITRHYDFAEELVKRGHDVTVFASSFDHKLRVETIEGNEKYKEEYLNGVRFVWLRTTPYKKNDIKRAMNILSFASRLYSIGSKLGDPDVVIASSFHPLTCIAGYFLAKKKKARYIAEIRDIWPQSAIDMGAIKEGGIIAKLLRKIEMFIYKRAKKIVLPLPGAVDYMKSVGVEEDKIVYLPNGVVVERYDEILNKPDENERIRDIAEEHKGKFKALYLGALGQANGVHSLIEAARILSEKSYSNIDILIVGDGPEKERLVEMSEKYNLKNVSFYSPVKKYEVPLLLREVDCPIAIMRDMEVFKYGISPNKLFDYLCSGKPIIFTGKVLNDIVKDADAGISIPPEKPEELAESIVKIYNMTEEERRKLGEHGRSYVENNHDIAVLADRLENIL